MCGIVGFSGKAGLEDRARFVALCRQSCIRGVHAFGIAWHSPATGLQVFKSTDFDETMKAVPNPLPDKIVFHNRYSTSGDWRVPDNNQPIHVRGNALVFNGTVDMGTSTECASMSPTHISRNCAAMVRAAGFLPTGTIRRVSSAKPCRYARTRDIALGRTYARTSKPCMTTNGQEQRDITAIARNGGRSFSE